MLNDLILITLFILIGLFISIAVACCKVSSGLDEFLYGDDEDD